MADSAHAYTDKELKRLEKKLERLYRQALTDVRREWDTYMRVHGKQLDALYKALEKAQRGGDIKAIERARKAYQAEFQRITLTDSRFKAMADRITQRITRVDSEVYELVNHLMPAIYAANYNSIFVPAGFAFGLIEPRMVTGLALGKFDILADAQWTRARLNSEILKGRLNGESISDIAKRLEPMVKGNKAAAIRNARTAITSAENRGRLDSMKAIDEECGLVHEKRWVATHDGHTRASHLEVDGEQVPLDEEFSNGLQYPGDPSGEPAEVYNCRCTMDKILVGIRRPDGSIMEVHYG